MYYTYSRWTGSQCLEGFDAETVIEALSDDLISDGDLKAALQRATRCGIGHGDQRSPGTQSLLQRLQSRRHEELHRYDLDSMVQDIKDRIAEIVATERDGVRMRRERGRAPDGDSAEDLRQALDAVAQRKVASLDRLPPEPGSAITALAQYEFLDDLAHAKFDALMDMLQRHVLQTHFQSMKESLSRLADGDVEEMVAALRALNALIEDRADGHSIDFVRFMGQHGRHFGEAGSLEHLLGRMQEEATHTESLLSSMTPDMRRALEDTMQSVLRHPGLRRETARLSAHLQATGMPRGMRHEYPFSGEQSLTLDEALGLMRRMHELDHLEHTLREAQESGDLSGIDVDTVRRLLGEESGQALDHLRALASVLEEAGYIARRGGTYALTARGVRRIGQKALHDIFRHVRVNPAGNHPAAAPGPGTDRGDETKPYEFGDPFFLDLSGTLMNAMRREPPAGSLRLSRDDIDVFRTEHLAEAATVLMLDMSRSMPLRGCFAAAKKVTLALNSLIRSRFPRDHLYVIGFSDFARELRPETLHELTWGDYLHGTNMQHGFLLARRLLGRHRSGNRQIILITDGEPTAYFEGERVQFSYPPTFRTFQETLREVRRCTQEGIIINTFMLERSHYLADFVNQMTRINRGRAFFATPERLGDYVLVDYVKGKRETR